MIVKKNIYVILVEPEYPANVGFVARCMMNFDFEHLILINPKCEINEAYIYSAHARNILEKAVILREIDDLKDFLDFLIGTTSKAGHDYNVQRMAITPKMLTNTINDVYGNIGLMFGRESIGLKNEELRLCDLIVTIPASRKYAALNLSHAVAIILYEIFLSNGNLQGKVGFREASLVEKEKLQEYFDKILDVLNYPIHRKERASIVFKRIIGRSFISGREAFIIMGALRRILLQLTNRITD
ncbi:MAG: RNA methyltransferase [Candidatus Methanomethylicia archaeon]|nr:RNA methyltransferase [Candidatus Methanomethylicia archaeon]MCX8169243.1 RNA methyltransferase [Candidatus Methanomethylicia archaeon]MDW7988975.1 RNA methyltransferase [Nitrososphaerota archaeon]